MVLKFEIVVLTNVAVSGFIDFYGPRRVRVEFSQSAGLQYHLYSELRKIHQTLLFEQ